MRITMNCPSCPSRLTFTLRATVTRNQGLSTACQNCNSRYRLHGGELSRDGAVPGAGGQR